MPPARGRMGLYARRASQGFAGGRTENYRFVYFHKRIIEIKKTCRKNTKNIKKLIDRYQNA